MDLANILCTKELKAVERRLKIAEALRMGTISIEEIIKIASDSDDKSIATVLEAMEEVTGKDPNIATIEWLQFAETHIDSKSNNLKREASRIIGNVAHLFENNLDVSIRKLLENTTNEGTVVRWGSAYAFARIIVLPCFANSPLFDKLTQICETETENGVKNQYIKGLKKALKLRK